MDGGQRENTLQPEKRPQAEHSRFRPKDASSLTPSHNHRAMILMALEADAPPRWLANCVVGCRWGHRNPESHRLVVWSWTIPAAIWPSPVTGSDSLAIVNAVAIATRTVPTARNLHIDNRIRSRAPET